MNRQGLYSPLYKGQVSGLILSWGVQSRLGPCLALKWFPFYRHCTLSLGAVKNHSPGMATGAILTHQQTSKASRRPLLYIFS